MNTKTVLHFGGGALGRGLVIPLLYQSGKDVILVDTDASLLDILKQENAYTLHISDEVEERRRQCIKLKKVLSSIENAEEVHNTLKDIDIVTTSVRRENLIHVARTLVSAWGDGDCSNKRVICCENVENVGEYVKELLASLAQDEKERAELAKIIVPNTIVDRICATSIDDKALITSEIFHECSVECHVLPDTNIQYITSVDNIQGHFYRKRYLLNAYADAICFLALSKHMTYLYEAASNKEINERILPYIQLLRNLLDVRYGITLEESAMWFTKYQQRLANPHIPRALDTVARNLWTKLTIDERFVRPLMELQEEGIDIHEGLLFIKELIDADNEQTSMKKTKEQILEQLRNLWNHDKTGKELYEAMQCIYETIRR